MERGREGDIYIYIYIYGERERERGIKKKENMVICNLHCLGFARTLRSSPRIGWK